jgi:threonine/homoserine/homoserine lactone efflux protein
MKIEPDWYRYLFGTAFLIWLAFWQWATFGEIRKEYRRRKAAQSAVEN